MLNRYQICERALRQAFGEQPSDDSNITINLVNSYLNDAIGVAARQNYKEALQIDGISYVNNSFSTTFKGLAITKDEQNYYKITLPQIPIGIGANEGCSRVVFKDSTGFISLEGVFLTQNQSTYYRMMKPIYNKILLIPEGLFIYAVSALPLFQYTASVTMVSGGDSTNLNSVLNVPDDYITVIVAYLAKMLQIERAAPKELANDGQAK